MQRKWHEVMPERWADDPDSDIDDLLPWADGIQKRFAMFEKRDLKVLTVNMHVELKSSGECPENGSPASNQWLKNCTNPCTDAPAYLNQIIW